MWFSQTLNNSVAFFTLFDSSQHNLPDYVNQFSENCGLEKMATEPTCDMNTVGTYCESLTMTHADGYGLESCQTVSNATIDCIGNVLSCVFTPHPKGEGFNYAGLIFSLAFCCVCFCCAFAIGASMKRNSGTKAEQIPLLKL